MMETKAKPACCKRPMGKDGSRKEAAEAGVAYDGSRPARLGHWQARWSRDADEYEASA